MSKVVRLPEALQDVAQFCEFLAGKSPEAACKAADRIGYVARQLEQFPELGQPMADGARRQTFLHFGAGEHVIRYRRDDEGNVVVVRVWHCREQRES